MGQNYSCKCNNQNEQKAGEMQLESKENVLIEKPEKIEDPTADCQPKAKSSNPINKTLEVIFQLLRK
jgi:hypothetical protein